MLKYTEQIALSAEAFLKAAKKVEKEDIRDTCKFCEKTGDYFCHRCVDKDVKREKNKEKKKKKPSQGINSPPKNWQ